MIFSQPNQSEPLTQGDIFQDCPLFAIAGNEESGQLESEPTRWKGRAIILTQACDLLNVKTLRAVVAVVYPTNVIVDEGILKASVIRDRVRRHMVFGWYFLPAFDESNFPESVVDLRNLHTLHLSAVKVLIKENNRICRLESPYREHLGQHLGNTYGRIALPEPYETE